MILNYGVRRTFYIGVSCIKASLTWYFVAKWVRDTLFGGGKLQEIETCSVRLAANKIDVHF